MHYLSINFLIISRSPSENVLKGTKRAKYIIIATKTLAMIFKGTEIMNNDIITVARAGLQTTL